MLLLNNPLKEHYKYPLFFALKGIVLFILIGCFEGKASVNVTHYHIVLSKIDFLNKTISGSTTIYFKQSESQDTVRFYLLKQVVDSVFLDQKAIGQYSYYDSVITLKTALINDTNQHQLRIVYHGTPVIGKDNWGGFFFQNNGCYNMGISMEENPHSFGRVWFPCVDNFTDKATFSFSITTPAQLSAVCNGTLIQKETSKDDRFVTYHWQLKHPIPCYLANVAIGEYAEYKDTYTSITGKKIPIHIFTKPSDIEKVDTVFYFLKKTMQIFENHWGEYVWERIGYVFVPFENGAMEHATNITIAENQFCTEFGCQKIMIHELAHSWFGNLVTCETKNDVWFNEGFATYCEQLAMSGLINKQKAEEMNLYNHFLSLEYGEDSKKEKYAITHLPHEKTYSISSYQKASTYICFLEHEMGELNFKKGINRLLEEQKFQTINSASFPDFLTPDSASQALNPKQLFNDWFNKPAVPYFYIFPIDTVFNESKNEWIFRFKIKAKSNIDSVKYLATTLVPVTILNELNLKNDTTLCFYPDKEVVYSLTSTKKNTLIILDAENKIPDLNIYGMLNLPENEKTNSLFPYSNVEFRASSLQNRASVLVETIWLKPEDMGTKTTLNRFWNISATNSKLKGKIVFHLNEYPSIELFLSTLKPAQQIVVYWRKNDLSQWTAIPSNQVKDDEFNLTVEVDYRQGQFCFGKE